MPLVMELLKCGCEPGEFGMSDRRTSPLDLEGLDIRISWLTTVTAFGRVRMMTAFEASFPMLDRSLGTRFIAHGGV